MANGYKGSPNLETSVADAEIIPAPPAGWVNTIYHFYKFEFLNDQDCHILINGSQTGIFIRANQGFEVDINDVPITSFKVVEAGITYNWVGHF